MFNWYIAFVKFYLSVVSSIEDHFACLYRQCDPLQPKTNKSIDPTLHWFYALFVLLFLLLCGTVGFQYYATGTFSLDSLSSSPYTFVHQAAPRAIWQQADICAALDTLNALAILAVLFLNRPIVNQLKFTLDEEISRVLIGSVVVKRDESEKILLIRKRIKLTLILSLGMFDLLTTLILIGFACFLADTKFLNWFTILFWITLFPQFILYAIFGIFALIIYITLASVYIQILQKALVLQLMQLNYSGKQNKSMTIRKHLRFNRQYIELCKPIRAYSNYCSSFLSVLFPTYFSIQCYLLYVNLYVHSTPLIIKQLFYLAIVELNVFLFLFTGQCAKVARNNRKFTRLNRAFYHNTFVKHFVAGHFRAKQMLKVEALQIGNRLKPYSFRVFGNFRITSNTYVLIITYISGFFMFLCKRYFDHSDTDEITN